MNSKKCESNFDDSQNVMVIPKKEPNKNKKKSLYVGVEILIVLLINTITNSNNRRKKNSRLFKFLDKPTTSFPYLLPKYIIKVAPGTAAILSGK